MPNLNRGSLFLQRTSLACIALISAAPLGAQLTVYPSVYPAAKQGGQYMHNYYLPPSPSSTPWWPEWSPDGKFIAFAMHGAIWKVEVATGIATQLTVSGARYHSSPAWSPDGRWIVYTSDHDGRRIGLESLNVETGATVELTSGDHLYLDPVFSPDGATLAYVSSRPSGHFNIYLRPIRNGQWAGDEVAVTRDNSYQRDRLYFGPWDFHTQPAWTPDGKELLFVCNRGNALGSGDIWRMPARRDGFDEARRVHAEQTLYRTRPHVSIDGKRFVYSSTSGSADQYSNLYVLPVQGGQPYKITFGDFDAFHPRWSPDGEWLAYIANEGGLPQLWLLETYGGKRRRVDLKELRWKQPVGKLRLLTGGPARVHLFAADGKSYAPPTTYARRGRTGVPSFHTEGEDLFAVPAGRTRVVVVQGFARKPAEAEVTVPAGGVAELKVNLAPLGFEQTGWFSGSTHVHMNYAGNLHNTPANLLRMARAEGMDLVMDQVANKDNRILDYHHFVPGGGEHPASMSFRDVKLHIGQEYRPPFYGHVFFLGLREHLISPFTTGYEGTGIESLYPSNTDMFRKARAQGAVNGYVHAFAGEADPLQGELGVAKGFAVDAALGTFECLEWSGSGRGSLGVLHHAWNNDLRIAPAGGEDSISSLHWTKLVGSVRTYVYTGGELAVRPWLDALRQGRTYMSTGPLLQFRMNNQIPGGEIRLPAGGGDVAFEARAGSIAPLSKIVIYRNGVEWKSVPAAGWKDSVKITESGWYSLYAEGPDYPMLDGEYPQAVTNAIRVYVGDGRIRSRASAEYFLRWIDKLQGLAEKWPGWRSDKEKRHVYAQFDEARAVYRRLSEEAK